MLGERHVFQYLLADGEEAVLIDAGTSRTPHEVIAPALKEIGLPAEQLKAIIVTHPDLDHQGGLAGLAELYPGARLACGFLDQALVSDPELLVSARYGAYEAQHGVGYGEADRVWMRSLYGAPVQLDVTFSGNETLAVGDRRLKMLSLPGHSAGHLGIWDEEAGLLFSSDAIHWKMCPAADGSPALPPTYEEVDDYLRTIEKVEALGDLTIHSGHWQPRSGEEAVAFLRESREFVAAMDATLVELLDSPRTLAWLLPEVEKRLGPFGADPVNLMFVVAGHLRHLVANGSIEAVDPSEVPPRYRAVGEGGDS